MEEMGSLSGRRILIVEDDYFIAQILTQMLEDAGAVVLGPIGQVEEALNFIGRNGSAVDSAVLDLNLHGIPSYPIADALVEQGIRFVFATGYDAGTIREAYRGYPHCGKPFQEDTLLAALRHPAA